MGGASGKNRQKFPSDFYLLILLFYILLELKNKH